MDGFNSVFVCSFYSVNVCRAEGVTHGGRGAEIYQRQEREGERWREIEWGRIEAERGREEGKRARIRERVKSQTGNAIQSQKKRREQ